jgi:hypothetical protein
MNYLMILFVWALTGFVFGVVIMFTQDLELEFKNIEKYKNPVLLISILILFLPWVVLAGVGVLGYIVYSLVVRYRIRREFERRKREGLKEVYDEISSDYIEAVKGMNELERERFSLLFMLEMQEQSLAKYDSMSMKEHDFMSETLGVTRELMEAQVNRAKLALEEFDEKHGIMVE